MNAFRFDLVAADGTVVGVCERAVPLRRDDVVSPEGGDVRWRVLATLGCIARVEAMSGVDRAPRVLRVSVSSGDAARSLAGELGAGARAERTPRGWIVSLQIADESRVSGLTRLAAASRAVMHSHPDAQLFVLDGDRPIRLPPPL